MARYFDGSSTYAKILDNAVLSLPDGSWTLGGWFNSDAFAGSGWQYLVSHGSLGATASCNIYIAEPNGDLIVWIVSNDGTSKTSTSSSVITAGRWHHMLAVCSGDALQVHLDAAAIGDSYSAAWDGADPIGSFHLGTKNNQQNRFDGRMAEWARWDAALDSQQIAALADGVRPTEVGTRPAWYLPLLGDLREEIAGLTVTNYGTTISEHPAAIICPGIPHVLRSAFPTIGGLYKVSAAATHISGAAQGQIFSTGTTIGQIDGY